MRSWQRPVAQLALVVALRMLGLFMVVPIMMSVMHDFEGATTFTMGLAMGLYGLTQATCQLPLGYLSDRWGRRPVLCMGLSLFVLGSLICWNAQHMGVLILGRALQGAGAIGATAMAWLTDLTNTAQRRIAMAIMGLSIGTAFLLASVLGSLLLAHINFSELFLISAGLGILGILLLIGIPTPTQQSKLNWRVGIRAVYQVPEALLYQLSVAGLHALFAAIWIVVPLRAIALSNWLPEQLWQGYALTLLGSIPCLVWLLRGGDRSLQAIPWLKRSLGLWWLAWTLLSFSPWPMGFWLGLSLIWIVFNLLEASLPSWYAKRLPEQHRGLAMGLYATAQFFGIFIGSSLAGLAWHYGQVIALWCWCSTGLLLAYFYIRQYTVHSL